MIIRQAQLRAIASGDVTLAFRRWRAPTVKSGGTLRTTIGVLAIDDVQVVQEEEITDAMAGAAGYRSREELLTELSKVPRSTTYCIRLRLSGPDPRIVLRERADVTSEEFEAIREMLDRLDRNSKRGPWTRATLQTIERNPGRLAADLAASLGWEKAWFKPQVRKLKELGLTESLDVGYRLSPRGRSVLASLV
jgi:hypothetical protein